MENRGLASETVKEYKQKMADKKQSYLLIPSEDNSEDYANFYFIGTYEGKEVIYDAAIYTLRLFYQSELLDLAEHKAAQRFPDFKKIKYEEDENGDMRVLDDRQEELGLMITEIMYELEEEEAVKVQEHVEVDENIDFGIGLEACLHVDEVTPKVIEKFVKDYTSGQLELDQTLYTFEDADEEEE